ncbi:hypothetical protein DFH09DRAFT_1328189 [Mycena vulgaris]|nr:hypothetical protein DFH09DRAFT_1328189 [Mycena vulgaris]
MGGKPRRVPTKSSTSGKRRRVYVHDPTREDMSTASTATNSRVRQERNPAPPPSPEKRRRLDVFDIAMGYGEDDDLPGPAGPPEGPAGIKVKKKKKKAPRNGESDHPMLAFVPQRNRFQDALLCCEGRGPWWSKGCMGVSCLELRPAFRCEDCFGGRLFCRVCIVERHRDEPLHIVQVWKDDYFQPCSLRDIDPSLRFQLGHPPGDDCDFREAHKFVVLDNNGIHEVKVHFCGCIGAPSLRDQLINIGWYPATVKEPETVATLSLLQRFHTLNLQGRVPGYDFYNALVVLSERAGMIDIPDRSKQFTLIVQEYRHLQMCKRGGRGHDAGGVPMKPGSSELLYGIDATQPGELSIPCRACPHPEINMLPGWRELLPDRAWINQILLSEDANFKMKGRATSSREVDPTLGPGFAYMVASDEYLTHLAKYVDEDEISHCVAFAALWRANNKRGKGLRAMGIGSKGERYSNMDYLWFSSIMGITLLSIIASYDITCQWGINFWEQMKKMPAHMRLPAGVKVQFKVPKFHLPPHVKKCHGPYSFNFTKWVGRMDGEGVERNWSWLNMAARSVSVMGPGSREDTIDDFCGFANCRKTCGLGNSLLRKMVLYIPRAMIHNRAFQAFTDSLKEKHETELVDWENLVKAWEQDHGKPCRTIIRRRMLTMDQVRLRIAEEAHVRTMEHGESKTNSPGAFILAAMEIDQETILLKARRRNRTSIQAVELQRKRTLLLTMVGRFRDKQAHFMPGIATWLAERPAENKAKPESIGLYLPSSFAAEARAVMCVEGLPEEEDRLRNAQAVEGLWDLRRHLRTRTFAHTFRCLHTGGQGQALYTKSQALQSGIEVRIKAAASCYRTARAGLLALRGTGEWEQTFQTLHFHNARGMNERALNAEEKEEEHRARALAGLPPAEEAVDEYGDPVEQTVLFNLETGEGHRVLSWIWYTSTTGDTGADGLLHDDIRVEWTKARARADRWQEELLFLEEEMLEVSAARVSPELAEGLCAYAKEQAARERRWEQKWALQWAPVRARAQLALSDVLVDVEDALEVELEDEVTYGEEGQIDDLD